MKRTTAILATAAAAASFMLTPTTATATAQTSTGTTSLAEVLAADGLEFDGKWRDFDILDQAVNDVIADDADSPVAILADGTARLTAFAPTDRAFRRLVADLTGSKPANEAATYEAVASLGLDTVEAALLHHVVPGATITYRQAMKADGARLDTASGKKIRVDVKRRLDRVFLVDKDRNDRNAFVLPRAKNINQGNRQIAHGVSQVLRPVNL
ncbi:fasciclin domain-containing protein [Nocardioides sp.]|uniref:fasciclin domain-containing protein n=1 Tax=Nocardioides sp. TaxID=35761 RepID=UPI002ED0E8BB